MLVYTVQMIKVLTQTFQDQMNNNTSSEYETFYIEHLMVGYTDYTGR